MLFELERDLPNSIEVTRNAKGDYQWTIKLYCEPGTESRTVTRMQKLDTKLRDMFLTRELREVA